MRKVISSPQTIRFSNIGEPGQVSIYTAFDASYARLNDIHSISGTMVFLQGTKPGANVMSWRSNKQQIPPSSPLMAEGEAALEAHATTRLVRALLADVFRAPDPTTSFPARLVTDSKSLYDATQSDSSIRDRRSGIAVCTLRRCTEFDNMMVTWVPGTDNPADLLTKEGVSPDLVQGILSGRTALPEGGYIQRCPLYTPAPAVQLDWQAPPQTLHHNGVLSESGLQEAAT